MSEQEKAAMRAAVSALFAIAEGALTTSRQRIDDSLDLDETAKARLRKAIDASLGELHKSLTVELKRCDDLP